MKDLKTFMHESDSTVYKVRQNNKIRYGKFIKSDKKYAYMSRMFPKTDNEGNIESFEEQKYKKTGKNKYDATTELMQIKLVSFNKKKEMKLNFTYGWYE